MRWGGDRNIIEEAGPMAKFEGEVGSLTSPFLAPALDVGKVVLEGLGSGVWVRVTIKDTGIVSQGG